MKTTRQEKIERMLEKELGELMLKYQNKIHGVMLSVTKVNISPDLSIAHVNVSIFPSEKAQEVMEGIELNGKNFRYELGQRVHNQMRIIPQLKWHVDDTLDYMQHIDELLKK
ncbi:MAG: 30S ribosome-binding factor RbfA [Paludibacteraceae bacterium]|jgi:ribosome-binding factor A|nr:30S ribosome-binding factor RbfA [Paludibacteraceae bacterium]